MTTINEAFAELERRERNLTGFQALRAALGSLSSAELRRELALRDAENIDYPDDPDEASVSEYDTLDSRGEKLRPSVNEAGEPWWM